MSTPPSKRKAVPMMYLFTSYMNQEPIITHHFYQRMPFPEIIEGYKRHIVQSSDGRADVYASIIYDLVFSHMREIEKLCQRMFRYQREVDCKISPLLLDIVLARRIVLKGCDTLSHVEKLVAEYYTVRVHLLYFTLTLGEDGGGSSQVESQTFSWL